MPRQDFMDSRFFSMIHIGYVPAVGEAVFFVAGVLTSMLPPVPTLPRMTPLSFTLNWLPPDVIPSGWFTCSAAIL